MGIEKINEIQNEARAIFNLLQQLQAPMVEGNIAIMNACLGSLKMIGNICEEAKKGAEEDAGESDDE